MKTNNTSIMRHILEIRLKNRMFEFTDFKGNFLDFLIKKTGYENVQIRGDRIDIANQDITEAFFFSWENFGFQIDAVNNFEIFKKKVLELFLILDSYKKYKFDDIRRIGTRTSILTHNKGESLDSINDKYKMAFFKNNKLLENKIGFDLVDTGYFIEDLEKDGSKLNLFTGPVRKEEAIIKFFEGRQEYNAFNKENGIYLSLDLFQAKEQSITDNNILRQKAETNIESLEDIFRGFIDYIEGQE